MPAPHQHPLGRPLELFFYEVGDVERAVPTQYWTSGLTETANDSLAQSIGVEVR